MVKEMIRKTEVASLYKAVKDGKIVGYVVELKKGGLFKYRVIDNAVSKYNKVHINHMKGIKNV